MIPFHSKQPTPTSFPTMLMVLIISTVAWSLIGEIGHSLGQQARNALTIQNDSGQFALVKIVGPTRTVAKIPLDQKKTVLIAPGEYYILVRFGFAPKEYIYTKGKPFLVTQEGDQFSYTTITLHRVVAGMDNPHEVSGEEFENLTISSGQ